MGFVLLASGVLGAVLLLLFVWVARGTSPSAGPSERRGPVKPSGPAVAPSTAAPTPGTLVIPKSHPRLWWTPERLGRARTWYARNPFTPKQEDVLANALCYVLSRNKRYGQAAVARLLSFNIPEERLQQVSVDIYRWDDWVPVVFDWCHDQMTPDQRAKVIDHYNHCVEVIRKKPWGGPGMEGNNYYWGYLRNELNWAIASYHENPKAPTFLDWALTTRWQKSFLPYAAGPGRGGVTPEGPQYGRYLLQYPVLPFSTVRLLGRDLLGETDYYKEALFNLIYTTTPAPTFCKGVAKPYYQVFPFGDDETDGGHPSAGSWYYGDFMTAAAERWANAPAGQYARRWLAMVRPGRSAYVEAVDRGGRDRAFSDLPLDYYAPGPGYLYSRNRWGAQATSIFFQLGAVSGASHVHLDAGTFQVWRNGRWLSKESTGYHQEFNGGAANETISHNGILFQGLGLANAYQDGPAKVLRVESGAHHAYGAVDLSKAYRAHKSSHRDRDDNPYAASAVREFLFVKPLEALVILDRLEASAEKMPADEIAKTFVLHFPGRPQLDAPDRVLAVNGDQALRLFTLLPPKAQRRVVDEGDFKGKHLEPSYYQFRLEESHAGPRQSYFLHVLQAREAKGTDLQVRLREEADSWTVQIDHPTRGHAVVVFNKGMVSRGGAFGYSAREVPQKLSPLLDRIQGIRVTEKGPVWETP